MKTSPCEQMQAICAHPILLKHAADILKLGYLNNKKQRRELREELIKPVIGD